MDLRDKSSHTGFTITAVTSCVAQLFVLLTRESFNQVACDGRDYLYLYLESLLSETFVNFVNADDVDNLLSILSMLTTLITFCQFCQS